MSKINQIQSAIRALAPGSYQKLMDVYLYKRFGFSNITPLGSHTETDKTTKGTPDSYVRTDNGRFILIAYGSVNESPYDKIDKDILGCLDEEKTGIDINDIEQIICCHTSTNITPGQIKQLCSRFSNTLIIGLGELANDLYLKYPSIARDHLSIEIDTHQIFDVPDYIEYASKNAYATSLNMPLLCREHELNELKMLLKQESIILICGKSGSGKTRLALELVTAYSSEYKGLVKVIKSNSESIYEDLRMTFTDDQNYLILVDDADQLVQLDHLLHMSNSQDRKYAIKIVLTVRDYAREKLIHTIKAVCIPKLYELKPLSDENIAQVLSENLNIKNEECLKQIQKLAKGNIRLAIMAGTCVLNGNWGAITNAFDILDNYFSKIIEQMDHKEIMVATIIAFFDSFPLQEETLPFCIASENKIDFGEFIEISQRLHEKEIVSIFDNLAVKFEEQNLRDYLLYYVFFKKKWLTPSYMIDKAFLKYRGKVVFAFNTLIGLFNTEENVKYLDLEIKKAWSVVKGQSEQNAYQFLRTFHQVIPDETLMMVKQRIENLPEQHTDFNTFDFERNSNNHSINSELIQLLIEFKYTDHFEEALELIFLHLERNTENPMDFFFTFGEKLGFDQYSHQFGYEKEYILIITLLTYYSAHSTIESARCLTFCTNNLLKYQFSAVEGNRNNTISFCQFGLNACGKIFHIRAICMEAISVLFDNPEYKQFAMQSLLNYPDYTYHDSDKEILTHDMEEFSHYFSDRLIASDFDNCIILHRFHKICIRNKVSESKQIMAYKSNHIFSLYLSLKKDRSLIYDDWRTAEQERKTAIAEICHTTTDQEFELLWNSLVHCNAVQNSRDIWDIGTGIDLVFSSFNSERKRFMSTLESYIKNDTPCCNYFHSVISGLLNILGYKGAVAYIKSKEFTAKRLWLSRVYNLIPENEIDKDTCEYFIINLKEQAELNTKYTLSLPTVLKINMICPGFIVRYLSVLNDMCKACPNIISEFLNGIDITDMEQDHGIVQYFESDMDVIEKAYLSALHGKQYYDHDGRLFLQIIRRDPDFLSAVIRDRKESYPYNGDNEILSTLWDQSDYFDLIMTVIETLREDHTYSYYFNDIGEQLFMREQGKEERWTKQDDWIERYIMANSAKAEAINFIFEKVRNISDAQRKKAILCFCTGNKSFEAFQSIPLSRSHMSWSGSEIPVIENQISFFEEIKDNLRGIDYVEHRAYIDENIQWLQRRKEQVLLAEFIEDR